MLRTHGTAGDEARTPARPQDQLLEVYETSDAPRPAGTQKSKLVHATGLLHKTAYAFVFNTKGELLMWRRPADHPVQPDRRAREAAESARPSTDAAPPGDAPTNRRPRASCDRPALRRRWDVTHAHLLPGDTSCSALMRALADDLGLSVEEVGGGVFV